MRSIENSEPWPWQAAQDSPSVGEVITAACAVLALAGVLAQEAPAPRADGLYRWAEEKPAERVELEILRASLRSQDNLNEGFQLSVHASPKGDPPDHLCVVVGGTAIANGSGGSEGENRFFSFRIPAAHADAVGRFLGLAPVPRRHPGYRLATVFRTDKDEYAPGEAVKVKLRIVNVGTEPVRFWQGGMNRGARDNQYTFVGRVDEDALPDVGDDTNFGGLMRAVTIEPGTTLVGESARIAAPTVPL